MYLWCYFSLSGYDFTLVMREATIYLWVIDHVLTRTQCVSLFHPLQRRQELNSRTVSRLSLGDVGRGGGLLPDNMPDDNPYKTLRHIRSMVITVIKALVHHRVHLRCAEKPLDAPVKSGSQDVHYYYKAVWRVFLGHLSLFPFSWRLPICTQPLYSIHEIYLYLSTRRILPIQEQTFIVSPQKLQGLCID